MLVKIRGVVLRTVRFGESSLIVTAYTEEYGRQSFVMNSTRGVKATNKAAIMQPLYLVELEVYQKKGRDLQRIRESRLSPPFTSIPFDVKRSCQVIFLAEILNRILIEEESNPALFSFIEGSLIYLDSMGEGVSSFHLWFLTHLTGFLGIMPQLEEHGQGWLDMNKGVMVVREPLHLHYLEPGITEVLKKITQLGIQELATLKIDSSQRKKLLSKLLEYYHLHFGNLDRLQSLAVLKEVFEYNR